MYKLQFFFTFIFAVLLLFSLAVVSLSSCLQNFWDATLTYTPNNFKSKSCFFWHDTTTVVAETQRRSDHVVTEGHQEQ